MSGTTPGKIYIHNFTNVARNRQFTPLGFAIGIRLDYGSGNFNKPVPLKPGEQLEYTPTKDFVKFQAAADPSLKLGPAEWNTSFGMRKTSVHYYITQSTTDFGLVANVRRP